MSDYILQHHGVKGQKWGVRRYQNADGTLTDAGRKRLAKDVKKNTSWAVTMNKEYLNHEQHALSRMPEIQKLHSELSDSRKKLYKTMEFARKFNSNDKLVERYQEKAARKECEDNGITDPYRIRDMIFGYKYRDFDQGNNNSFAVYCRDKNVDYDKYQMAAYQAEQQYEQSCRRYANELLKEYGSKPVNNLFSNKQAPATVSDAVTRTLVEMMDNERYKKGLYVPT